MGEGLRFHWSMSSAGDPYRGALPRASQSGVPDLARLAEFCRTAEACGIESVLTAFGFHRPDPIVLATALAARTDRVSFMVAVRSGVCSPTSFVQQVNTVAAVTGGRICLNVVVGHTPEEQRGYGDFLSHDERYARTDEFLTICRALWESREPVTYEGSYYRVENARLNTPFAPGGRGGPEIYLGGNSPQAAALAARHASCLIRLPDTPARMRPEVEALREGGTEVALLVSLLVRPTAEEAIEAAGEMVGSLGSRPKQTHRAFRQRSDSVAFTSMLGRAEEADSPWLTPTLWTGAVPYLGAPAVALVGSPEDVASAILEYRSIGVTQFLFMGWPDVEEMTRFARDVAPIVREREGSPRALAV
ncbi:Alkanesulfonate monooxygenase [Aquisphaera giovannonii]|uniref:Alkanesulfonate monooxygenase n=1 Tax=Aquisphaera giovannonii TaxID=406548 RepID=A0A5B9WF92_9BACT|nr:LLM class flavin-dependent oxidoreductase [Aquisphaera giovannonii]QEH38550.1 Alkanesulfonate monooxygenase [Aquisphaera giovannonii]